jgi:phosphatidylinositol 3,5-bisphosphate 5-phosphatase
LLLITSKKKVAKIGFHDIYQIKDMKMIPLFKQTSKMRQEEENKYVKLFLQIKINEGFYFSYTYDLTHTLQNNIINKIKKNNEQDD